MERRFRLWMSVTALLAIGGLAVGGALAQDGDGSKTSQPAQGEVTAPPKKSGTTSEAGQPKTPTAAPKAPTTSQPASTSGATQEPPKASASPAAREPSKSEASTPSTSPPAGAPPKASAAPKASEPPKATAAPSAPETAPQEPSAAPSTPSPVAPATASAAPASPTSAPPTRPEDAAADAPKTPPAEAPAAAAEASKSPPAASAAPAKEPPAEAAAPEEEAPKPEPVAVRIGGKNVYLVRVAQGTVSIEDRARSAEQAIRKAVETEKPESVRVESLGDATVVYAGTLPLLRLTAEDAIAAGDASLGVHADRVASELRDVIRAEQKRSAIATTIFSFSLAALLTLAALLLLRKTSEITERVRAWVAAHRERIPGIRLQSVEVVDAATIRSAVALGVEVLKWVLRAGLVYLWLLLTLSLFESTREYTQDLTGIVLTPLSSLMARIAKSLPVVVVALIAIAVIAVLVRFVDLFFAGVARGETKLRWLAPDLAAPTSILLRVAIVLGAVVFAAPVVTGDDEGALGKIGVIALAALGLSGTPLLASAIAGTGILFGRRLRIGDFVEFGGRSGRVVALSLLEVRLEDSEGLEVRVPHLLSFLHSTRIVGTRPRTNLELCVADHSERTAELLREAASKVGERVKVEVLAVEATFVRYRISVASGRPDVRNALFFALMEALREAGVSLSSERQPSMAGVA